MQVTVHGVVAAENLARAVADIASREHTEGIQASHPQAFFGAAMDQKLAQIESRNQRLLQP